MKFLKRFNTVYNGFWFFGESGFTGGSFFGNTKYTLAQSITIFQVPGWFPFWKYREFGFTRWAPRKDSYKEEIIESLSEHFDVFLDVYDDCGELKEHIPWSSHLDQNNGLVSLFSRLDGSYAGCPRNGQFYLDKGLTQLQASHPFDKDKETISTSLGFNEEDQKWYGWSHRAFYGFTIGSSCKKGDCAYIPDSADELYNDLVDEENVKPEDVIKNDTSISIKHYYYNTSPSNDPEVYNSEKEIPGGSIEVSDEAIEYPEEPDGFELQEIKIGRGAWTALTLDDAKQMAMDYASGVS